MSNNVVKVGDIVEVQDRGGVERYCVDGAFYKVVEAHESGMVRLMDDMDSFWIPRSQVKRVND